MNTVGYIRVSTEEQARGGLSLDMQREKIGQYCDLHGLGSPVFFADEGISGKAIADRPGLGALLTTALRSGHGTHVVIYKIDRMARNTRELLGLVEQFQKNKIGFHSVTERVDTKSATGRFFVTIIAAIAEWERNVISERTRDVLQTKIANGGRVGRPRFGWRVEYGPEIDHKGKKVPHYVADEGQQAHIERIMKLTDEGLSRRSIADQLGLNPGTVQHVIEHQRGGAE